jgi:hypothetical protein
MSHLLPNVENIRTKYRLQRRLKSGLVITKAHRPSGWCSFNNSQPYLLLLAAVRPLVAEGARDEVVTEGDEQEGPKAAICTARPPWRTLKPKLMVAIVPPSTCRGDVLMKQGRPRGVWCCDAS